LGNHGPQDIRYWTKMFYQLATRIIDAAEISEATTKQLARKHRSITRLFPTFKDRVDKIGPMGGLKLNGQTADTWKFKVHSGTKSSTWYDVVVRFVNVPVVLGKLVADRRLWTSDKTRVDYRLLSREFMDRIDIQLECSCPADLYWGHQYTRSRAKYDAKYGSPETRRPKKRNPREYGANCFDDRAMVLMGDGTFKSIKDVVVGDVVFSHTGKRRKVLNTFCREAKVFDVGVWGVLGKFGVTGNHPFYVLGRNAECLCGCGKKFSTKRRTIESKGIKHIYTRKLWSGHTTIRQEDMSNELIWVEAENLDRYSLLFSPNLDFGSGDVTKSIDPDVARLVGYYVAEGSLLYDYSGSRKDAGLLFRNSCGKDVIGRGVSFTISLDEVDTIGADIIRILKEKFGVVATTKEIHCDRKDGTKSEYAIISARGKDLFKFIYGLIGFTKRLDESILGWNSAAKWWLIAGWLLGDGYIGKNDGSHTIISSNGILSQQVFSIISSLGVRADIKEYKSTNTSGFVGKRWYTMVRSNDVPDAVTECFINLGKRNSEVDHTPQFNTFRVSDFTKRDDGFFRMFRSIDKSNQRIADVYNIEVDVDNSYIVNGVVVHNCKHISALMKALPWYNSTVARWLKEFYGKGIAKVEKSARAESEFAKKAAGALAQRAEDVKAKADAEPKHEAEPGTNDSVPESVDHGAIFCRILESFDSSKFINESEDSDDPLIRHAEYELKLAGVGNQDSDYGGMLYDAVMDLIREFSKQGHSGMSASMTLAMFDKLARFDALTDVTDNPDEWMEFTDGKWQSRRSSSKFSSDGGKTYYDIDDWVTDDGHGVKVIGKPKTLKMYTSKKWGNS